MNNYLLPAFYFALTDRIILNHLCNDFRDGQIRLPAAFLYKFSPNFPREKIPVLPAGSSSHSPARLKSQHRNFTTATPVIQHPQRYIQEDILFTIMHNFSPKRTANFQAHYSTITCLTANKKARLYTYYCSG